MKHKILSLILVFAMTVSLFTVGASAAEPTYGDTAGHWAEASIERWSAYGIIQGSNGKFDPNGQLTCAQLATILARLLKLPAAKDAGFIDNPADAWYYDAINRCAAAGILKGNGDGTVTPEAPITRERAMVMLARALGIEPLRNPDLTRYTDAAQVSAYAQGYVAALIEAGIVGGVTADELAPQDSINRASTVTILDRAISTYADKAGATVKADGKGIVLVVAENVKITGAPEGTKIVVADGATGLTVNGKSVSDDQTYIVPKTEPAKPSSGSSGGYSHSHSYVYTDNGDGTHTATCYAGDATFTEQHHLVDGQCTLCGAAQTDKSVASVNTGSGYVYYDTLAAAVNAAVDGATVTLMKGTEEDITVSGSKALTIDLNGMKLTNNSGDTIVVEIGATLTVTGSGTVDNVTHGKAAIYNNGTVILNGGSYTRSAEASTSIENANGNSYYNILNHGTMTIEENVSVISSGSFSSLIANGYYNFSDTNPRSGYVSGTNQEAPSLTINGGTFSGGINTIKNDDNATLTVNNGSFSNMTQAAIQNNHVATINGGAFDANANHAIENRHFDGGHNTGSVTVTNGVFTGGLYTTEGAAWNITGGTFSSDPSAYVAERYKVTRLEDGKYQVVALFAGGSGTEAYPFLISSADQLKAFRDSVNAGTTYSGKYIQLTTDINLNNEEWLPIGEKAGDKFSGTFDGQTHIIEGLSITATQEIGNEATFDGYAGFFGAINGGTVKNLSVYGSVSGKNVAGVVARVDGNSSVKNCHNHATVTSTNNAKAGGVICLTNAASITVQNCTNSGAVSGGTGGTAGIVAYANPGVTISGCSNTGNIGNASSKYAGGIVGYATNDNSSAEINDCTNSGAITASVSAGGIVGIATEAWTITNCKNSGAVSGTGSSGGIIGSVKNGTISSCSNTATVHGDQFAGGVVGTVASAAQIVNCSGGISNITSSARILKFTNGVVADLECTETTCAGRLIGTNQGGGPGVWASITIDDDNGDSYDKIGAIGICGNTTSWANIEIAGGTLHGTPAVGNQTYLRITENASWDDTQGRTPGTYTGTRIAGDTQPVWTLQTP